jgi:hypothetical protein
MKKEIRKVLSYMLSFIIMLSIIFLVGCETKEQKRIKEEQIRQEQIEQAKAEQIKQEQLEKAKAEQLKQKQIEEAKIKQEKINSNILNIAKEIINQTVKYAKLYDTNYDALPDSVKWNYNKSVKFFYDTIKERKITHTSNLIVERKSRKSSTYSGDSNIEFFVIRKSTSSKEGFGIEIDGDIEKKINLLIYPVEIKNGEINYFNNMYDFTFKVNTQNGKILMYNVFESRFFAFN